MFLGFPSTWIFMQKGKPKLLFTAFPCPGMGPGRSGGDRALLASPAAVPNPWWR